LPLPLWAGSFKKAKEMPEWNSLILWVLMECFDDQAGQFALFVGIFPEGIGYFGRQRMPVAKIRKAYYPSNWLIKKYTENMMRNIPKSDTSVFESVFISSLAPAYAMGMTPSPMEAVIARSI